MNSKRQRSDSISVVEDIPTVPFFTRVWVFIAIHTIKLFAYSYVIILWPIYWLFTKKQPITGTNNHNEPQAAPISLINGKPDNSASWRAYQDLELPLGTTPFKEISNVPGLFYRALRLWPDRKILGRRQLISMEMELQPNGRKFKKLTQGAYQWLSYSQLDARINNLVWALTQRLGLSVQAGHRLLVFSETRIEWQLTALACFRLGLPVVTLYSTLGEEAVVHGINESEVAVIFTSDELLASVVKLLPKTPLVRALVYFREPEHDSVPGNDFVVPEIPATVELLSLAELEEAGRRLCAENPTSLQVAAPTADSLALIMYTSGSTGQPKGVELTQGNMLASVSGFSSRLMNTLSESDRFLAYLPLAHIMELTCETMLITFGVPVGYGSALTLVDTGSKVKRGTKGDVRELRPTLLACVPTILDRIHKSVWEQIRAQGPFFVQLFTWALEFRRHRLECGYPSVVMDKLVFRKIRRMLGGRLRLMISGGAPLSSADQDFINNTFCRLVQGYGLTETCCCGTIGSFNDLRGGHVGIPTGATQIRLQAWLDGGYSPEDVPRPRGEILIGGHCVARGYFKQPEKTAEDFFCDEKGVRWFRTGDIGLLHEDGTLSIIDRKKDLVKLQMGEYISLGKVELALTSCPLVEQICIYGDGLADSVLALVVPKRANLLEMARKVLETASNDPAALHWLQRLQDSKSSGSGGDSGGGELTPEEYAELLQCDRVRRGALKMLEMTAREKQLQRTEIPSQVWLSGQPWTPDNGLLTAALKLKRRAIQDVFQVSIDRMYGRESEGNRSGEAR